MKELTITISTRRLQTELFTPDPFEHNMPRDPHPSLPTLMSLTALPSDILLAIFREIETRDVVRVGMVGCNPCLPSADL